MGEEEGGTLSMSNDIIKEDLYISRRRTPKEMKQELEWKLRSAKSEIHKWKGMYLESNLALLPTLAKVTAKGGRGLMIRQDNGYKVKMKKDSDLIDELLLASTGENRLTKLDAQVGNKVNTMTLLRYGLLKTEPSSPTEGMGTRKYYITEAGLRVLADVVCSDKDLVTLIVPGNKEWMAWFVAQSW
jgi:hypothetical protein